MSEWIKRSEQEPPTNVWIFKWDERRANHQPVWVSESGPVGYFTHWQPANAPAPPPRTVTIEISEEDARLFSRCFYEERPSLSFRDMASLGEACRRALEEQR